MKQTLPIGRALLIALITTIIYLLVIFSIQELDNYGGLAMFFATPGVFIGVFVWCYIMLILESTNIMASHFIFRFLTPFLFFSLLFWVFANIGEDPIISSFQAYNFTAYIGYFLDFMKNAVMILGSLFLVLATLFTLLVKKEKLTQNEQGQ